jgi:hypothetical protein
VLRRRHPVGTSCTFGKGKLAVTLVDTATDRQVRISYQPTLQPQIRSSAFMQKRAAGVPFSSRGLNPLPARGPSAWALPDRACRIEVPLSGDAFARPERTRQGALDIRWKPALNAFAITFEGRVFPSSTL